MTPTQCVCLMAALLAVSAPPARAVEPGAGGPETGDSRIYYEIGGATAAGASGFTRLNNPARIGASARIGLGYSCSGFDPNLAIQNTLNNLKDRLVTLPGQVTGMLGALPGYVLCRANNLACQLLQDYTLRAEREVDLSLKSCQQIRAEAARGQDPFADWLSIGVADKWRREARRSTDVTDARARVDRYRGEDGIPWLGGRRAGGQGQPPLRPVNDTVRAGYNLLLGRAAARNGPVAEAQKTRFSRRWPTPQAAADWVVSVTGDQAVVVYQDNSRTAPGAGATAGLGLLPSVEREARAIQQKLRVIVAGGELVTDKALDAVSARDVRITRELVRALQTSASRDLFMNKLAGEVASARVIDDALMARQLLATGQREPHIAAAPPARAGVTEAMRELERAIQQLAFEKEIREALISKTSLILLEQQGRRTSKKAAAPEEGNSDPLAESALDRE